MEKIKTYIIAGLVLFLIVFFSVRSCQKQEIKQEVKTVDSTGFFKKQLATIQAQSEAKEKKWHEDSLKIKASEKRYERVAVKAQKERDVALEKIRDVADSMPEVKDFIEKDSVSDKIKTDRIREQEIEKVQITEDCRARLDAKDDEIKLTNDFKDYFKNQNVELRKDVKKQIRLKTVWKIVSGVLVAVIVYEVVTD